jgi:hypothetical protein
VRIYRAHPARLDTTAGGEEKASGRTVAICNIIEDPRQTEKQADQVAAHLRSTGPVLPEGARLFLSGSADPGWRVITVWDSAEARDQFFTERLVPAYEAVGLSLDGVARTQFEVHMLTAGDLFGAARPA